jgi:hypothetical protein
MPPVRFEPTIPASEQQQTHALDRAAAGIGSMTNTYKQFFPSSLYMFPLHKRGWTDRVDSKKKLVASALSSYHFTESVKLCSHYLLAALVEPSCRVLPAVGACNYRICDNVWQQVPFPAANQPDKHMRACVFWMLEVGLISRRWKQTHYEKPFSTVKYIVGSFVVLPSSTYLFTVGVEVVCLFSLNHTQTHTTVGRTPLDEGSACRRYLYLTTQTLTRDKHPYAGRDSNPRSQQALGRRPKP